jgi:hypothetical protein
VRVLLVNIKTVIVTDANKRALQTSEATTVSVTIIPVVPDNQYSRIELDQKPLKFESVSLLTYEAPPSDEPLSATAGI